MRLLIIIVLLIATSGLIVIQFDQVAERDRPITANVENLVGEEDLSGFAQATEVRPIRFPADLGAHPDYFLEWWYYTGNLQDGAGHDYGYQFTLFRRGMTPGELTGRISEWASNQVYFAHFTVTDATGETFEFHERFSRGTPGLAGVQAEPYHIWLNDWFVKEIPSAEPDLNGLPRRVNLRAEAGTVGLDLVLELTKPATLQGDNGLSQKSFEPGNASYYYSLTNQKTSGTITTPRGTFEVTGTSWKDHEWSTSQLADNAVGWDWFSLKLAGDLEVMFYYIRLQDGGIEPASKGSIIYPDGTARIFPTEAVEITPLDYWESPDSGAEYPVAWQFVMPSEGLDLQITALIPHQELRVSTTYWEGAVQVTGSHSGYGYVELTGYNESIQNRVQAGQN